MKACKGKNKGGCVLVEIIPKPNTKPIKMAA